MPSKKPGLDLVASRDGGLIKNLVLHAKLIWALMKDRRVNFLLKILPVASLLYLVSPIDILPDLVLPVIGALDDAAVIWIGTTLFLSLCPEDIVEEHKQALNAGSHASSRSHPQDDVVVDGESRDVTDEMRM